MTYGQTLTGYVVIVALAAAYEIVARRSRRMTAKAVAAAAATGRWTRWPVLAAWLWLGWHLFARSGTAG